jgi:integrase/recombinase XerD
MSFDTVRHLIGHAPGSRELERTYQHLVDEDYIENAELDMGIRDEREESLTPEVCPQCSEPLQPHYDVCPNCHMTFSPKAEQLKDDANERKAAGALDAADPETKEKVHTLIKTLDDPEKLNQLYAVVEGLDAESIEDAAESL